MALLVTGLIIFFAAHTFTMFPWGARKPDRQAWRRPLQGPLPCGVANRIRGADLRLRQRAQDRHLGAAAVDATRDNGLLSIGRGSVAGRVQENQPALRSAMLRQVDVVVVEPRAPETVAGEVWHPCAGRLRGSVVECRQGQFGVARERGGCYWSGYVLRAGRDGRGCAE